MRRLYPFFLVLIPLLWGFTQYPKLVGDEGIYVSQAWWLVGFGKLGPYTYWYDHFPLGWAMIGIWQKLTGGPFLLEIAEFSGRLFSIILVSLGALFLHGISFTLTKSRLIAFLTIAIYATSPLAITFHRQVLLENTAVIWLLTSLWLLLTKTDAKPISAIASSFFLGLAILTKESLLFLIPPFLLGSFLILKTQANWKLLITISLITLISTLSLFPLLAFIKGELVSGSPDSISLIQTITHQLSRGSSLPFWSSESDFSQKLDVWIYLDPILMLVGLGGFGFNFLTDFKRKKHLTLHLFTLFFFFFLLRGGLVLEHYIIPAISLLSLQIGLFIQKITTFKRSNWVIVSATAALLIFNTSRLVSLNTVNATQTQLESYHHLVQNAAADDYIVTDNYFFLNLRFNPDLSDRFPHTHWYTKIDQDPYTQTDLFEQHGGTIDWLLLSDMIKTDIQNGISPILAQAKKTALTDKEFPLDMTDDTITNLYQQTPYVIEPTVIYRAKTTDTNLKTLNSTQLLGRLIWLSINQPSLDTTEIDLLQNQHATGVVIGKSAIINSTQLDNLINQIINAAPPQNPPIIAISFEGGPDTPIPWLSGINPGSLKSTSEAKEMAINRSNQLKKIGFNTILGPIIDIRRKNSVYDQTNTVPKEAEFSQEIAKTYQEMGLIPFVRWFPGSYSGIETASLPETNVVIKTINQDYISPYITFFKNNLKPAGVIVGDFSFENDLILPSLLTSLKTNTNANFAVLTDPKTLIYPKGLEYILSQGITTIIVPNTQEYAQFIKSESSTTIIIDKNHLDSAIKTNQELLEKIHTVNQ